MNFRNTEKETLDCLGPDEQICAAAVAVAPALEKVMKFEKLSFRGDAHA